MKKYTNKLITIKYKDRTSTISGIVLDYNDNWTYLMYNPLDFQIDGFIILKNKNIDYFQYGQEQKFKEKVIKANLQNLTGRHVDLTNISSILGALKENFNLIQIETKSERACYIGNIRSMSDFKITLNNLTPEGKFKGSIDMSPNLIRTIQFENNYLLSIQKIIKSKKYLKSKSI